MNAHDALLRDCLYWQRYSAARALTGRTFLFNFLEYGVLRDGRDAIQKQRLAAEGAREAREALLTLLGGHNG